MDSDKFLLLNGAIVIGLVLFLLLGGRRKEGLRFGRNGRLPQVAKAPLNDLPPIRGERSLNCFFMFNGHSFDAFEVLGIPAGSGTADVERALRDALRRAPDSKDLFQTAAKAIRSQRPS